MWRLILELQIWSGTATTTSHVWISQVDPVDTLMLTGCQHNIFLTHNLVYHMTRCTYLLKELLSIN